MTACFNKNTVEGKGMSNGAKAVSATLATALAMGMVPGMAMAADDVVMDASADYQFELLVADEVVDVAKGDITEATDNEGNALDLSKNIKFTVGEETMYVVPTMVETFSDTDFDPENGIVCYYVVDTDGEIIDMPWAKAGEKLSLIPDPENYGWGIGKYYVTVSSDDATSPESATAVKFEIEAASLKDAYLIEGNDVKDTVFTYNGTDLASSINMTFGKKGDLNKGTDYTVEVLSDYENDELDGTMIDAGEYVVRVKGVNNYDGFKKDYKIEVGALDLAAADVVLADDCKLYDIASEEILNPAVASVNGSGAMNADLELTFTDSSAGNYLANPIAEKGSYTYTLAAADEEDGNFKNNKEITLVRYAAEAEIEYDDEAMSGALDADAVFDADQISVKDADGKKLPYELKLEKAQEDGSYIEVEDVTKPGDYRATVTVSSDDPTVGFDYGGQAQLTFHVAALEINPDTNVFISYVGDEGFISSKRTEYTGADLSKNFIVAVYNDDDEKLVEGTDYVVKFFNADGEEVDELVNIGNYTLVVESADGYMYEFVGGSNEIAVEIEPIKVNPSLKNVKELNYQTGLAYTGKAIVPEFEYVSDDNDTPFDFEDDTYTDLDSSLYTVAYKMFDTKTGEYVDVDSMIKAGMYEITLTMNKDVENYEFVGDVSADGKSVVVYADVIDASKFADVPAGAWFAEVVDQVSQEGGYMFGYSGTNFFGPYDDVIRGDAAVVFFRMAKGDTWSDGDSDGSFDNWTGHETPFKDVKASKYYAESIAWAAKVGIIKGYGDGTHYGPDDSMTREQYAVMLMRYADLNGDYKPVEDVDAVLAKYLDGDKVSNWAKPAVAWACANGYMGLDTTVVNPSADITRAELAAMTVRYQPVEPQPNN